MNTEQINEIADHLEFGLRCFVHHKTNSIVVFPEYADFNAPEWLAAQKEVKRFPASYREISKMPANEGYGVMEQFSSTIQHEKIRTRAERALSNPKPFRYFNSMIDDSGEYRELWLAFRRRHLIEYVTLQLKSMEKIPRRSAGPIENFF